MTFETKEWRVYKVWAQFKRIKSTNYEKCILSLVKLKLPEIYCQNMILTTIFQNQIKTKISFESLLSFHLKKIKSSENKYFLLQG